MYIYIYIYNFFFFCPQSCIYLLKNTIEIVILKYYKTIEFKIDLNKVYSFGLQCHMVNVANSISIIQDSLMYKNKTFHFNTVRKHKYLYKSQS